MPTINSNNLIPAQVMAELQAAAERAAKGVRDPEIMAKACARMDRLREDIRRQHGILNIGVPAIRELRDGE
jgi:hypothetical protein